MANQCLQDAEYHKAMYNVAITYARRYFAEAKSQMPDVHRTAYPYNHSSPLQPSPLPPSPNLTTSGSDRDDPFVKNLVRSTERIAMMRNLPRGTHTHVHSQFEKTERFPLPPDLASGVSGGGGGLLFTKKAIAAMRALSQPHIPSAGRVGSTRPSQPFISPLGIGRLIVLNTTRQLTERLVQPVKQFNAVRARASSVPFRTRPNMAQTPICTRCVVHDYEE